MSDKEKTLTSARLKQLVSYDESTGIFTSNIQRGRLKKGAVAGYIKTQGHIAIHIDGNSHFAHRLAWLYAYGEFPAGQIDHINRIKTDNRISNLRIVSHQHNQQNQDKARKDSRSGLRGASKHSDGRWQATITIGNKYKYIGLFDTAELAHAAYIQAKIDNHEGFVP
jgi:HNH endonuclease/AP2 domain